MSEMWEKIDQKPPVLFLSGYLYNGKSVSRTDNAGNAGGGNCAKRIAIRKKENTSVSYTP